MSTVFDKTFSKGVLGVKSSTKTFSIISSRVRDIILDSSHDKFTEFGEWNGIGTIFFEPVKFPTFSETINLIPAAPAFPNIKQYPLINELVPIVYLADTNVGENTANVIAYYLPPINVWNSQVHNAVPVNRVITGSQQSSDYEQTEAGSLRRVKDSDTDIDLGNTFNENNVINNYPLLPYEGDTIYEGRYSNSIRLGSTVKTSTNSKPNSWSEVGTNGDPITIIRNGQGNTLRNVVDNNESWVPALENINLDKSSVYLTSTQKLNLEPSSQRYSSVSDSLIGIQQYTNNSQIVLNSGRLVFNTKSDSILLSSKQHIHLSTENTFEVNAGMKIVLESSDIKFGSSATEPLVLGDTLSIQLEEITSVLNAIYLAFKNATVEVIDPVTGQIKSQPVISLQSFANSIKTTAKNLQQAIDDKRFLSKTVKTI